MQNSRKSLSHLEIGLISNLCTYFRITFCGITMKNYVERNISSKSQTTLKYAMKMLSGSSETIIFMFLGVATIHDDHDWNWAFVSLTILFATVFRVLGELVVHSSPLLVTNKKSCNVMK